MLMIRMTNAMTVIDNVTVQPASRSSGAPRRRRSNVDRSGAALPDRRPRGSGRTRVVSGAGGSGDSLTRIGARIWVSGSGVVTMRGMGAVFGVVGAA